MVLATKEKQRLITTEVMEAYMQVAGYMCDITFNELSTGITDTEKFIAYYKGAYLDLGIKVGDPVKPGSPVAEAMQSRKRVIRHIPKQVIGIPYIITANPVFDSEGNVVGAIATGTTTEKEVLIKESAEELSAAIEQISSAVNHLVSETEKFSSINEELSVVSGQAREEVANTNKVLDYIRDISGDTKVLGINASIEASRAGSQGLGFRVVAAEIQKLANSTMKSVKSIEEAQSKLQKTVDTFAAKVDEFSRYTQAQMAMTEETFATIEQLRRMSANMLESVKGII